MKAKRHPTCWRCGQLTLIVHNFCASCGAPLRPELAWSLSTRRCPRCKRTIPLLARYCPQCGEKR
ncbi:MAG: zinc ribbon domain-containing protein [Nitrososphaeria archaeon]